MLSSVFSNHMHQFNGLMYKQLLGAPIGLRLTSVVAHIVMDQWVKKFLVPITDAGVKVHLLVIYVDDINVILSMLPLGTQWVGGVSVHDPVLETEDKQVGKTA